MVEDIIVGKVTTFNKSPTVRPQNFQTFISHNFGDIIVKKNSFSILGYLSKVITFSTVTSSNEFWLEGVTV